MRWFHERLDRLHIAAIELAMPRAFRHGITSPPLREHLDAIRLDLPPLTASKKRYRLTAETLAGPLDCGYRVRLGPRPDLPVLIYHHGIAEMPYDKSFQGIFGIKRNLDAHLVAIQAPFHQTWWTVAKGLSTFTQFMAMCAVSVAMMEAIRRLFQEAGADQCLISGISLGGFLALAHHLLMGTADRYAPLLAGPDLAHVMLETPFRRLLAPEARAQAETLRGHLDFRSAFQDRETRHIFPLLARCDLDMPYAHLYPCYAASQVPVVTISRGHITGICALATLRKHLLSCLEPLIQMATANPQPEEPTWLQT